MLFSERTNIKPSSLRKIFDEIKILRELGHEVLNLAVGQPHIEINPLVLKGLSAFLNLSKAGNLFGYTPSEGTFEVRESIVISD